MFGQDHKKKEFQRRIFLEKKNLHDYYTITKLQLKQRQVWLIVCLRILNDCF